jgi:hypothetical protein
VTLLPEVLKAAASPAAAVPDAVMAALAERTGMSSIFGI